MLLFKEAEKTVREVAKEELEEALSAYHQAEQNFEYAEDDFFVEKAIYDLKSAESRLSYVIRKMRAEIYGNQLINSRTN